MGIRPYQHEGLASIATYYQSGCHRQLLVMPTGTGKTVVFAQLPTLLAKMGLAGQVLVLAHRKELIAQAADKLKHWNPTLSVGVERAEEISDPHADIVVASVPTIGRKDSARLSKFNPDRFAAVVCDEAHHATADTYQRVFSHFGFRQLPDRDSEDFYSSDHNRLLLGVTATPQRGDEVPLGLVFQNEVFNYPLRKAIEEGWLVDLRAFRISTSANISRVRTTAGDFNAGDLSKAINTHDRNQEIVKAWLDHGEGRISLAFCEGIAHAQDLADMFRHFGVDSVAIWDGDAERDAKIERLRRGEVKVVTNCGILTEGFDCWRIGCILMARPTKSSLLYIQMVGRGTRLEDGVENLNSIAPTAEVKRDCLILDFVDNCGRHNIVTANMLFDLPDTLVLKGQSLLKAKQELEQRPTIDYSHLQKMEDVATYTDEVSLFDFTVPAELEQAQLRWHRVNQSHYALSFSDHNDPASNVSFHLRQTAIGLWQGHLATGAPMFEQAVDFNDGIRRIENCVKTLNSKVFWLLNRKAKWNSEAATPSQMKFVEREWKKRSNKPIPVLTKGQASDFLDRVWNRRSHA